MRLRRQEESLSDTERGKSRDYVTMIWPRKNHMTIPTITPPSFLQDIRILTCQQITGRYDICSILKGWQRGQHIENIKGWNHSVLPISLDLRLLTERGSTGFWDHFRRRDVSFRSNTSCETWIKCHQWEECSSGKGSLALLYNEAISKAFVQLQRSPFRCFNTLKGILTLRRFGVYKSEGVIKCESRVVKLF